jgi:hypothetical protein
MPLNKYSNKEETACATPSENKLAASSDCVPQYRLQPELLDNQVLPAEAGTLNTVTQRLESPASFILRKS